MTAIGGSSSSAATLSSSVKFPPSQFPKSSTFSPHPTPLNPPKCTLRSENPLPPNAVVSKPSPLEILKTSSVDRYTKEKTSIIVIGLNVHTAPVEMREKLAIPEAQWPQVIQELCALNHIEEAAVLSTCNRIEIYLVALSQHRAVREVTDWISKLSGVSIPEICKHQILLYNKDATQHLFEVAAGLDSLVLGEGQILSQVKQVVKSGQGVPGFDRKISGLFKQAISVGKRVRTEKNISSGSVSVSSAAVELALMKRSVASFDDALVSDMTSPFFTNFSNRRHHIHHNAESNQIIPEVRSNYMSISNPQKLFNPFSLFKGFMSGDLKEETQNIFPALSTFNYFKNISEVTFDKNRKIVTAYLENDPIWATASWSDMMGNMEHNHSFKSNTYESSKVIESFGSSMDELDKLSHELKASARKADFGPSKYEFDLMRSEMEKNYPTFYIKNIMKRNNPTILEYNVQFLTSLGYEPSDFASNILRHGVPEIYPNMQKKYSSMVKEIISILIKGNYDGKPIEKQIKLLHSNLQVCPVKETVYLMRSFNRDNELEIEIFSVYEDLQEPIKIEEEVAKMSAPQKITVPSMELEREEFLKKFYNIKKKDESDAARTCRIRFL